MVKGIATHNANVGWGGALTQSAEVVIQSRRMANVDGRGIRRGNCTACSCDSYDRGLVGRRCEDCGHPPGKHRNLDIPVVTEDLSTADSSGVNLNNELSDLYVSSSLDEVEPPDEEPITVPIIAPPIPPQLSDGKRCCYPDCNKPRFIEKDKMHPFCGRSHATLYRQEFQGTYVVFIPNPSY